MPKRRKEKTDIEERFWTAEKHLMKVIIKEVEERERRDQRFIKRIDFLEKRIQDNQKEMHEMRKIINVLYSQTGLPEIK